METVKIQKRKLEGSFTNYLMGNNASIPQIGKGATEIHYTDRTCFDVIEVSADGKIVKMEYLDAEFDKTKSGGQGHQDWILKPTGQFKIIIWRNNGWYQKVQQVVFTKEYVQEMKLNGIECIGIHLSKHEPELLERIYGGNMLPINAVEGYTKFKNTYHKVNIMFGVKDYHYDWSF